jgi:hypothetical protein
MSGNRGGGARRAARKQRREHLRAQYGTVSFENHHLLQDDDRKEDAPAARAPLAIPGMEYDPGSTGAAAQVALRLTASTGTQ